MDYLKLKDKEYPFLFAIKAQKEMQNVELKGKDDVYFIWLGFKYGAMAEGKVFEYTEEGLVDIFEVDMAAYEKAAEMLGQHLGKLQKMKGLVTKAIQ